MFNENQLFYATLWWASGLPGGAEHVPALLARHGKDPVIFPPREIKRGRRKANPFTMSYEEIAQLEENIARGYNPADAILSTEILDTFFDHLLTALQKKEKLQYTATGKDRYLDLRHHFATSSNHPAYPDFPFTDEIEAAIAAAGIQRHALPQNLCVYAHDDGQLFAPTKDQAGQWKMVSVDYPGRPALPYTPINMTSADMDHCQTLTWETLYRVVLLKAGEKYTSGYISVAGNRVTMEREVHTDNNNKVLTISNGDVEPPELLSTLTDEEIRSFHPSIRSSLDCHAEEYTAGYKNESAGTSVESTDNPNIVRHLRPGVAFMIAATPVQIGCGSSFSIAQSGDFIIREGKGYSVRVMEKSRVDSGELRFILPPPPAKDPKLSLN